jgi:hypothetical protein
LGMRRLDSESPQQGFPFQPTGYKGDHNNSQGSCLPTQHVTAQRKIHLQACKNVTRLQICTLLRHQHEWEMNAYQKHGCI